MSYIQKKCGDSKTANIILVYKNISIQDYENISSVYSWINPLARLTTSFQDFVLSLGKRLLLKRRVALIICGGAK